MRPGRREKPCSRSTRSDPGMLGDFARSQSYNNDNNNNNNNENNNTN